MMAKHKFKTKQTQKRIEKKHKHENDPNVPLK